MFKKIMSCLMASAIFVSSGILSVSAEETEKSIPMQTAEVFTTQDYAKSYNEIIPEMLNVIYSDSSNGGFTQSELANAYLGKEFSIAHIDENSKSMCNSGIKYIPLMNNDNIIGIISLSKHNNDISCNIGISFSKQLNSFMKNNANEEISLISMNNNIYAISKNDIKAIEGDDLNKKTVNKNILLNSCKTNSKSATTDVKTENNTISIKSLQTDIKKINTTRSGVLRSKYLDNYPIVGQGHHPWCWAASIASILRYEMPNTYPSTSACDVTNLCGSSHDIEDCKKYLNNLLDDVYKPCIYNRALTNPEIEVVINNNDPAFMGYYSVVGGAHATVLCGYAFCHAYEMIKIMNPGANNGAGDYEYCNITSSGYDLHYANMGYKWKKTIRLKY